MLPRRRLLQASALLLPLGAPRADGLPARQLQFPRDHGSHPDLRTEWWYLTGHVHVGPRRYGFQVTFFRSRVDSTQQMRSRFAAKQLIFAHAAVTDLQSQQHWHDQRMAREGFGIALASESDTHVQLRDWSLVRAPNGTYTSHIVADNFTLHVDCTPTQPVLLQGQDGLSRKGPEPEQASYYYSQPQLATQGQLTLHTPSASPVPISGTAWLDHEWSQALLHPRAVGWEWIGINLNDGGALTAFRLRDAQGQALWSAGSYRPAPTPSAPHPPVARIFGPNDIRFHPLRHWQSPASQATYPVAWRVQTPLGDYTVDALVDSQELDSRATTGTIYWEGLSQLQDAQGRTIGYGYLEMTGYVGALSL